MKRILLIILMLSVFCFAQERLDYGNYTTYSDTILTTTVEFAKTSGAFISSLYMYNMSASYPAFVHFYNSADSATVGTTEATLWYGIPKDEGLYIQFYGMGIPFNAAVQYAATKVYDGATAPDSTVIINVIYYND